MKVEDVFYTLSAVFLVVTLAFIFVAEGAFSLETGRAAARGLMLLFWAVGMLIRLGRWLEQRSHTQRTRTATDIRGTAE